MLGRTFSLGSLEEFCVLNCLPCVPSIFNINELVDELQVADEIVAEYAGTDSDTTASSEVQFNSIVINFCIQPFLLL